LRLSQIVEQLGGELLGDPAREVNGLAPLSTAESSHLSFLANPRYLKQLESSRAGCVIVGPEVSAVAKSRGDCIVSDNPYRYFAQVTQLWKRRLELPVQQRVHPSAVIDPLAEVHPSAQIGALCVIESGAFIGADTVLKARVTVAEGCRIGQRCILHSGVVIGADGFGFARFEGGWEKIEQLGAVLVGDDVEIGANSCVDRGALEDTILEDGVKIDNLVQIGHNARVGRNTAMAGCVGIAGSATIGENCTLGGGAIVLGHLTLANDVHISAASVVTRSIHQPGHYTGMFPIDDNANWEKNAAAVKQLHRLRDRIRLIEASRERQD
jgi:UDP-3-O-[3-hydroxymyristoyl] glucosamine N-acyltransferase